MPLSFEESYTRSRVKCLWCDGKILRARGGRSVSHHTSIGCSKTSANATSSCSPPQTPSRPMFFSGKKSLKRAEWVWMCVVANARRDRWSTDPLPGNIDPCPALTDRNRQLPSPFTSETRSRILFVQCIHKRCSQRSQSKKIKFIRMQPLVLQRPQPHQIRGCRVVWKV